MLGGRGYHSLAVTSDGTVWAWGYNRNGELGYDTTGQACPKLSHSTCSDVPEQVDGVSNPLMVTGGGFFSLALMQDHTVMGWGEDNHGELGDGQYNDQPAPVHASAVLSHVVQISAGWFHALALTDTGHVLAWGDNGAGEIGIGVTSTQGISVPVEVPGLDHVIKVSAGDGFSGALKDNGTAWTWGGNTYGQLGDATFNDSASPVQVHNLGDAKQYTARDYHDLAVLDDGTVWDWGSNENGELGNNTIGDSDVPVEVIFPAGPPPQWMLWLPFLMR
jgi:alpha-tubulin suppressor-like RCC1 family protein